MFKELFEANGKLTPEEYEANIKATSKAIADVLKKRKESPKVIFKKSRNPSYFSDWGIEYENSQGGKDAGLEHLEVRYSGRTKLKNPWEVSYFKYAEDSEIDASFDNLEDAMSWIKKLKRK